MCCYGELNHGTASETDVIKRIGFPTCCYHSVDNNERNLPQGIYMYESILKRALIRASILEPRGSNNNNYIKKKKQSLATNQY